MAFYVLLFAAGLQLSTTIVYIRSMFKGTTKPNRVTFFIWTFAAFIAVPAALSDGAGWEVLPVFMSGFGPLLVLIASFAAPYAYWKLGRLDYACGAFSLLALVLWGVTQNPFYAVLFAIVSDALALFPTLIKTWSFPETEHYAAYAGAIFGSVAALFVAESFVFTAVAFQIYLIVACGIVIVFIFQKELHIRVVRWYTPRNEV